MTQDAAIPDATRLLIGREMDPITLEVTTTGCRMFARAVGHMDRIFYDRDTARRLGYPDLVAPPGYLGTPIFDPAADSRSLVRRLGIPLDRGMNAGTELEYLDTVCAGDVLVAVPRIADITERDGSLGRMVFVTIETEYRRGEQLVAQARNTSILY